MKHSELLLAATTCIALTFASCEKPKPQEEVSALPERGAIVLNEGGWGCNEAELSAIDYSDMTITNSVFSKLNGRGLGDVAQDVVVYGDKIYVAVWGSNTVEVLDRKTGKSTQIDMGNRGPRYIACDGGKVYVTCYTPESVVRIDTATLQLEATCRLSGMRPEGICALAGKLYVVNSWKPDEAGNAAYDSTLSVVDIATFTETSKIAIGLNPQKVKVVDNSHLAISYNGDYGTCPGGIAIVDAITLDVQKKAASVSNIESYGGKVYYYGNTIGQTWNGCIYVLNHASMESESITLEGTDAFSATYYPYAININPNTGEIYMAGAQYGANGDIYCFTQMGRLKWKLEAGPLPSKIVQL